MLEHILNLTFHGNDKEDNEIDDQDRPKHWDVKDTEQGHGESNRKGLGAAPPEYQSDTDNTKHS